MVFFHEEKRYPMPKDLIALTTGQCEAHFFFASIISENVVAACDLLENSKELVSRMGIEIQGSEITYVRYGGDDRNNLFDVSSIALYAL